MGTSGSTNETCRLCGNPVQRYLADKTARVYLRCPRCGLIQLSVHALPDPVSEKARYLHHNNSAEDPRYVAYQKEFAQRTVFRVLAPPAKILELGSGPTPVLSTLLREAGFSVVIHDPYFFPHPRALDGTYDAVVAVEVIEHVHYPGAFFDQLSPVVATGGFSCFRTGIWRGTVDEFTGWWYRQDTTHVGFYTERTIAYIARHWFQDQNPTIEENTAIFRRNSI